MPESVSNNVLYNVGTERRIAWIAFVNFLFLIMAYYVLKPIRESLALDLGSQNVPGLNILSLLSLIIGNALYSWIVGRFQPQRFIPGITWFFVICLLIFWCIFHFVSFPKSETKSLFLMYLSISSYYIWVNIFALVSTSMFWSYINDVCTTDQGKRLYGFIGYGGLIGGLLGGILTASMATMIGTTNLLLVAAVLLFPTAWLPIWLPRNHNSDTRESLSIHGASPLGAHSSTKSQPWDGLICTFRSTLLLFLALETFCYTFASSLFSYQVNALVEESLPSRDLRTVYWAQLYNAINGVSLLTQFTLTRLFMQLSVPIWGLLILPISQILGSLWLIRDASLAVAATVVVFRYATNYSTGRALRELMYTLTSREEKYQGKGFIDTLVFRAGDGLSSLLLLWGLNWYGPSIWIDATIIGVMGVSIVAIVALSYKFRASLAISDRVCAAKPTSF